MKKSVFIILITCILISCDAEKGKTKFDETGEKLVKLTLHAGRFDPDLVDSYYGDLEIDSSKEYEINDLKEEFKILYAEIEKANTESKSQELRKNYQLALVKAIKERLKFIDLKPSSFMVECENYYQFVPELKEKAYYDSLLIKLDSLLPGEDGLRSRLANYKSNFIIRQSKVNKSFRTAIKRAAEITKEHMKLPQNEGIRLEYLDGAPWSAYNWYLGNYQSLIQINKLSSVYIERIIDLAAHESYPGHHVYYSIREKNFYTDSNFIEFSIYPLFSPVSFLAEGMAEYGNDLAFPLEDKIKFLQDEISYDKSYTREEFIKYFEIINLVDQLNEYVINIAKAYVDDEIERDRAAYLIQKYGMESEQNSYRRLKFIDKFRSYIVSYVYGKQLVKDYIYKKAGNNNELKWKVYNELLSNPYLPNDLVKELKSS